MTRGIIGVILALLMFSCMDAVAKGLVERYPAAQVVWARYASQTGFMLLLFLPSLHLRLRTRYLKLQLFRSLFLFCATACFFTTLTFMPLAEVAAVFQMAPLLITILGAVVLREHVGPRRWIGVVIGLAGVMIILRPGSGLFQIAALLPALGALCYASYQISTRFLRGGDSIWTTMLYTTGVGTVLATLALPWFWVTPTTEDALIMAGFGGFGLAGHLCLVYALGQAPASALAPFNYLSFVWASLLGFVWFAEVPDLMTVVGAAVIVSAGIYVWHRERVRGVR
ncbi:DMT family transporter [Rhodobacteraceae bacterium NNCM2]|nr:DMT family transporter [Coraliihabitans acroporae]